MPHVKRADDHDEQLSWQKLERQTVRFEIQHGPGESNTQLRGRFAEEVLGPDGMDRDMIAELVAARYHVTTHMEDQNTSTNTTPGFAQSRTFVGINVEEQDSVLFQNGPQADVQERYEGATTSGEIESNVGDDPGILFETQQGVAPAFNDTVNGSGGGNSGEHDTVEKYDYRDLFGRGPVVDATDDLQANLRLQHDAVGGQSEVKFIGHFWWLPMTVEGARPQFGIPPA